MMTSQKYQVVVDSLTIVLKNKKNLFSIVQNILYLSKPTDFSLTIFKYTKLPKFMSTNFSSAEQLIWMFGWPQAFAQPTSKYDCW